MKGPDLVAEHMMLVILKELGVGLTHPDCSATTSGALNLVICPGSPASPEQGGSISAGPTTPDRGAGEHRAVATPSPQQSKVGCLSTSASRQCRASCPENGKLSSSAASCSGDCAPWQFELDCHVTHADPETEMGLDHSGMLPCWCSPSYPPMLWVVMLLVQPSEGAGHIISGQTGLRSKAQRAVRRAVSAAGLASCAS